MGRMEERLHKTIKEYLDSIAFTYDEDDEELKTIFDIKLEKNLLLCNSYMLAENQQFGIFAILDYKIDKSKKDDVIWLVNEFNQNASIGRYFYNDLEDSICCLVESTYDESLISKSVISDMLTYLVNNARSIENAVIGLNSGELTREEANKLYLDEEILLSSRESFVDNSEKVYRTLCDAFDSINYSYEKNNDNDSIVFSVVDEDEDVGYSIRVVKEFKAIRLCAFVCDIASGTEKEILEAINLANNRISIGSFELNDGSIYYMSNLFYAESIISKESVLDLFRASFGICDALNNWFLDLTNGEISLDDFCDIFN